MTKIYSPQSNCDTKPQNQTDVTTQKLSTEDELFFDAIKKALHQIKKDPSETTIDNIVKYSKGL